MADHKRKRTSRTSSGITKKIRAARHKQLLSGHLSSLKFHYFSKTVFRNVRKTLNRLADEAKTKRPTYSEVYRSMLNAPA